MSKPLPSPLASRPGPLVIERRGLPRQLGAGVAKDAYHFLRTASWMRVILTFAALFAGLNLIAASVLYFGDATILNARAGSFADCYWFSVQTVATIGFGHLAPGGTLANVVVAVESFVGILLIATITGVFFARFSTPSARILFSRIALIGQHDGERVLMFRMANVRATGILEANARVYLLRDEQLADGSHHRKVYDLALRRPNTPMLILSWSVIHPIGPSSPLHGVREEDLAVGNPAIMVTVTGIDDRLAASVHTRHTYSADQLRFEHRFDDIISDDPITGNRVIDFARFHDARRVVAAAITPASSAAPP